MSDRNLINDIICKYTETWKILEEHDRGIFPKGHEQDKEFFKQNFLIGNWEALRSKYFWNSSRDDTTYRENWSIEVTF